MNKTKIEWVKNQDESRGYTWNPVTGCLYGCSYCYARKIANRFQGNFNPKFHTQRLNDPMKIKEPSTIFVGSMSDVFGTWVENEWINPILEVVRLCPQHTFIFLTKNPYRYRDFIFPFNCFLGHTCTNGTSGQFETLLKHPGSHNKRKYFISAEPLLDYVYLEGTEKWLIIGSLNQNGKPVHLDKGGTRKEWVLSLLDKADKHKIPVFIKPELYELYPDLPKRQELPYLKEK